jgi:hypothetical protein
MTANATQFEPIADPLSLSPSDFVSRARERGIEIKRDYYLIRTDRGLCGCAVGVGAVLKNPSRIGPLGLSAWGCEQALNISSDVRFAISNGFEGHPKTQVEKDDPRLSRLYDWASAVARAAGLKNEGGE